MGLSDFVNEHENLLICFLIILFFLFSFLIFLMFESFVDYANQGELKEEAFCKLKGFDNGVMIGSSSFKDYTDIKCFNETTIKLYDISYYKQFEYPLNFTNFNFIGKYLMKNMG